MNNLLNEKNNIKYLIIEGIFARNISSTLCNQNYYFLELKTDKNECMNRVIQRDIKERGKAKKQAEYDFLESWKIYYEKFKNKNITKKANEITINKSNQIDQIVKNLFE